MKNYWAIAVGINQYQRFQPLFYAERDAQLIQQFLVQEAGFPAGQVHVLGDSSPNGKADAAYPSRLNILESLTDLCQNRLQPDDVLWVFFSGYGAQLQGKDYLLPIDADPARINETGISIEAVMGILQAAPTRQVLLLLDMNRSQGLLASEGAGRQTLAIARDFGISTVLSCQPDQFSHETIVLRQGLFTEALVEGVRHHGCLTLEQLLLFLRDRLPQLSEHHCRPAQNPVGFVPDELRYQLIVPGKANQPGVAQQPSEFEGNAGGTHTTVGQAAFNASEGHEPSSNGLPVPPPLPDSASQSNTSSTSQASVGHNQPPPPDTISPSDERTWRRMLQWGGSALAALLLFVLARNIGTVMQPPEPQATPSPTTEPSPAVEPVSPEATAPTPVPETTAPAPTPAPEAVSEPAVPAPSPTPDGLAPVGQQPAAEGEFYGTVTPTSAQISAAQPISTIAPVGNETQWLQGARSLVASVQVEPGASVSRISEAIRMAKQIPSDHPLYAEAQQDVNRWSQMILNIAELRSVQPNGGNALIAAENFANAIAAAQLVPAEQAELRSLADASVTKWSKQMVDLATLQAYWGDLSLAVNVAKLIPSNTPSRAEAEQSIASWQAQIEQQRIAAQQADAYYTEPSYENTY
ncbi:caspase family protein [Leptolyngbya sp. AN02str]|uniref:caspase family protein n=1 Tax=Leptolyngbya sp. AN02str TaxID=3423363 RepID=UPI003D3177FD